MRYISIILILLTLLTILRTKQINQTIDCINSYVQTFRSKMRSDLFQIFKKSFPNTLETTITHYNFQKGSQQTYIITGDITAMWLRDSTNQFLPYIRIPKICPYVQDFARGLINTQAQFIMVDAYTNAYKKYQKAGERPFYLNDKTQMLIFGIPVDLCRRKQYATKTIWERKFQIDSLASFLRLSYEYTNKYDSIDYANLNFFKALKRIMSVIDQQTKDQAYEKDNKNYFYTFYRDARQLQNGHIKPSKRTGLIKTGFRPSDDPNQLAYNIPGNAMISTYLQLVADKVLNRIPTNSIFKSMSNILSRKMIMISQQIKKAIYDHGIVMYQGNQIFAYQIDGFGSVKTYDDANLPSLLSLPYLGFIPSSDKIYQDTRNFLLSPANKYYYSNGNIAGIGSSHTQNRYIWPLALMNQILTSNNDNQIKNCLVALQKFAVGNLNHESCSVDNPTKCTRDWFAWANSFFGEMIIKLSETKPQLLK